MRNFALTCNVERQVFVKINSTCVVYLHWSKKYHVIFLPQYSCDLKVLKTKILQPEDIQNEQQNFSIFMSPRDDIGKFLKSYVRGYHVVLVILLLSALGVDGSIKFWTIYLILHLK